MLNVSITPQQPRLDAVTLKQIIPGYLQVYISGNIRGEVDFSDVEEEIKIQIKLLRKMARELSEQKGVPVKWES